ncbi:MAG: PDZ domain-containing protein [Nocardioides sp.]
MTQRTWAAVLAVPLLLVLGMYSAIKPLPYVTYAPGLTINVLGDYDGHPVIDVQGHPVYPDSGQLRMTTVSVTDRNSHLDLLTLMRTWFSRDDGIYPYAIQYPSTGSAQQDAEEGQVEMISSQDDAIAAAMRQLGYTFTQNLQIVLVQPNMPAQGKLQVHDVLRRVGTTRVTAKTDIPKLIAAVPDGQSIPFTVERQGKQVTVRVTPTTVQGHRLVGIRLGVGYDFPFKVSVNINSDIGGPSAGLMFALSIYDTLTPGSLTSGGTIAGTGEITGHGKVGAIGGIQQKIVGARHDGAQLFLVPAPNCDDAVTSQHGSMRLARVATLKQAIAVVTAWGKNHDVALPQCTASKAAS